MAYGIEIYDASGNLRLGLPDYQSRILYSQLVTTSGTVTISWLNSTYHGCMYFNTCTGSFDEDIYGGSKVAYVITTISGTTLTWSAQAGSQGSKIDGLVIVYLKDFTSNLAGVMT